MQQKSKYFKYQPELITWCFESAKILQNLLDLLAVKVNAELQSFDEWVAWSFY
jgi:hypothetical protein